MEKQTRHFLLKILSGPHQGAEVALDDGDIEIGSSLECELILSDTLIAPNHLRISIGNEEIALTPLADKVYIDGIGITPKETKQINAFQYITLGTTHLVVGPSDETWPAMHPPELATLKEAGELQEPEVTPHDQRPLQARMAAKQKPAENKNEQEQIKIEGKASLLTTKNLIKAGGLVVSIILIAVASILLQEPEGPQRQLDEDDIPAAKAEILNTLSSLGIQEEYIKITDKFGQIKVEGSVHTRKEAQKASEALRAINPYYRTHFKSQESLVSASTGILEMLKAPVSVNSTQIGTIRVEGYFTDDKAWTQAKNSLLNDVPGLESVEDKVITGQDVRELAKPIMEKHNLTGSIKIYTPISGVVARGRLADNMRQVWTKTRMELEQALGNKVPFYDQVVLTPATERLYLDAPIESITITESLSWMALSNGKTFFEGSSVSSGYTVKEITREGVILARGQETVTLTVGDQ